MDQKDPPVYYPNLDVCRHALALSVLYAHCCLATHINYYLPVMPVQAFVCISGLVIPASLSASKGWPHFAWKRILRVMPAFLLAFILVAVLQGPSVVPGVALYYLTIGLAGSAVNSPLWSLGVEEILYGIHAAGRGVLKVWKPWMPALCLIVSCFFWHRLLQNHDYIGVANRYWGTVAAFFAGNLLSFVRWRRNGYVAALALGLALAFNYFNVYRLLGADLFTFTYLVGQSVLMVVFAVSIPQVPKLKFDFSYGIYIYHFPILTWFLANGYGVGRELLYVTLPATLVVSAFSWFGVERYALRLKNAFPLPAKAKVAVEAA